MLMMKMNSEMNLSIKCCLLYDILASIFSFHIYYFFLAFVCHKLTMIGVNFFFFFFLFSKPLVLTCEIHKDDCYFARLLVKQLGHSNS